MRKRPKFDPVVTMHRYIVFDESGRCRMETDDPRGRRIRRALSSYGKPLWIVDRELGKTKLVPFIGAT